MFGTRQRAAGAVLALIMLGWSAQAAPPLTQIQDTLYKADGTLFTGTATISWRTFVASDGSNIAQNTLTVQITGGVLKVKLVPTTNGSNGAYYTVKYNADGRTQFTEMWAVPPSGPALPVRLVRLDTPPTVAATPPNNITQISDVEGLAEALAERPLKSVDYRPGRALVANAAGEVAPASGSAADCVRVDGTSGPCGSALVFVDLETPAGTINGTNTAFTLTKAPSPASSLMLFRNGILQKVTVDYTLSGSTVTFMSVSVPQAGDLLSASYRAAQ
jgi:hypothetical protein